MKDCVGDDSGDNRPFVNSLEVNVYAFRFNTSPFRPIMDAAPKLLIPPSSKGAK